MGCSLSHSLFRQSSTPPYAKIIINLQFLGLIILFNAVKESILIRFLLKNKSYAFDI